MDGLTGPFGDGFSGLFEDEDLVSLPTRTNTLGSDFVHVHAVHAHLELLGQRMTRIESALDKILERLQLLPLNEDPHQPKVVNELHPTPPNPTPEAGITTHKPPQPEPKDVAVPKPLPGTYSYTELDTTKSQIRVLSLQRSENFTDPIVADLKIMNLDDDQTANYAQQGYTSLSYCWGPPIMDGSIILGGYHFPITKSLESALRHLRSMKTGFFPFDLTTGKFGNEEFWWIDQICINQADIDERGSQVNLMRLIYKRASAVHVWLGEEADNSDSAMDILTTLGAPPHRAPGEKAVEYPSFSEAQVRSHWKALGDFFKRPWWERVWIRQEVALSYNVKVSCGNKTCDMSVIGPALYLLNYIQNLGYDAPVGESSEDPGTSILPWDFHPKKLIELKDSTNNGFSFVDLSRLLRNARGCKATDPRDTVFSILGLADPEAYPIVPSYREELREIFITAAGAAVQKENGLDLFAACQNPERKSDLPSWVPNLLDPWKTMPFSLKDREGRRISELGVTHAFTPDARVDGECLILKGGLFDKIRVICEHFVNAGATAEELESTYVSWREFAEDAQFHNELEELEAYNYVEDHEVATARHWIRFLSVFWDNAEDLKGYSHSDYSWEKKSGNPLTANTNVLEEPDWRTNPYHHMLLNYKLSRSYLLPPSYTTAHLHPNRRIHAELQKNCIGRRLAITDRGYFALVPAEAEVGDPVAIFDGAAFPYVLRKVGKSKNHILVGEACIPRYLEAGAERLAEDLNFSLDASIRIC